MVVEHRGAQKRVAAPRFHEAQYGFVLNAFGLRFVASSWARHLNAASMVDTRLV